jgi:peptidoglycan/xylan/chitin deacetylase (PgdA/CDA1 family)
MESIKISLTFDDALDSQLDHAVPLLNAYGFKATFFVHISSECLVRRLDEWKKIATAGHELGNHSLLHPAEGKKSWITEGNALENYSLDRMRLELKTANSVLQMIDGKTERTFAYPCGNSRLGRCGWVKRLLVAAGLEKTRIVGWVEKYDLDLGSNYQDFSGITKDLFYASRLGGLPQHGKWPAKYDRYRIPSVAGDGCSIDELVRYIDKAIEKGGWTVFSFHGIGGGHGLYCNLDAFEQFIKQLASNEQVVVKPLLEAAKDIWG